MVVWIELHDFRLFTGAEKAAKRTVCISDLTIHSEAFQIEGLKRIVGEEHARFFS